jgi:exosome complex RNA-binding protein Rrp4
MCIKVYFFERKTMKNDFNSKQFPDIYPGDKGLKIWNFLNERDTVVRMQAVSDIGKPALLAIEKNLIFDFGIIEKENQKQISSEEKSKNDNLKRMIGSMVRQVLEQNGYVWVKSSKVTNSKLFSTAALYVEKA